jgi:hypothetical protein
MALIASLQLKILFSTHIKTISRKYLKQNFQWKRKIHSMIDGQTGTQISVRHEHMHRNVVRDLRI